jgi:hypothetical protein
MRRKAIIIESAKIQGERYLPGAEVDATNWKNFLKSDLGGNWLDSEIEPHTNPSGITIRRLIREAASGDYTFVVFSGHGAEGTVALNDTERRFPIADLTPQSTKGTLILDTCRGSDGGERYSFPSMATKSAYVALANSESRSVMMAMNERVENFSNIQDIISPRSLWHGYLEKASIGKVKMQSCAKGQSAGEDVNSGGYYTSLLMQSANKWYSLAKSMEQHTTHHAHIYARDNMPNKQRPEYTSSPVSTFREFPFAIKV